MTSTQTTPGTRLDGIARQMLDAARAADGLEPAADSNFEVAQSMHEKAPGSYSPIAAAYAQAAIAIAEADATCAALQRKYDGAVLMIADATALIEKLKAVDSSSPARTIGPDDKSWQQPVVVFANGQPVPQVGALDARTVDVVPGWDDALKTQRAAGTLYEVFAGFWQEVPKSLYDEAPDQHRRIRTLATAPQHKDAAGVDAHTDRLMRDKITADNAMARGELPGRDMSTFTDADFLEMTGAPAAQGDAEPFVWMDKATYDAVIDARGYGSFDVWNADCTAPRIPLYTTPRPIPDAAPARPVTE